MQAENCTTQNGQAPNASKQCSQGFLHEGHRMKPFADSKRDFMLCNDSNASSTLTSLGGGRRKSLGPMSSSDTCFSKTQNYAKTQTIDRNVHESDRSPCDLQALYSSWFATYLAKPMHSIQIGDIGVEGDNVVLRKTSARHGDS